MGVILIERLLNRGFEVNDLDKLFFGEDLIYIF